MARRSDIGPAERARRSPGLVALALGFVMIAVAGCATSVARDPVPVAALDRAAPLGFDLVRTWGDETPQNVEELAARSAAQLRASGATRNQTMHYLALSGGGSDGAYGAGLLVGWTARGDRPDFHIVTGISTGALIAPFAFLGSEYDPQMREIYTQYSTDQLVSPQVLNALFGGVAVADNSKLANILETYITPAILRAVAREYQRGRRLLIGTTNLDAQRPVFWDMGRIAVAGTPQALKLFRQVLLASAAIPGLFPPVMIDVEADGQRHEEMHVDGGTTTQVFFLPGNVDISNLARGHGIDAKHRLYIIRNSKLAPQFESVNATTLSIASRSISTLIRSQGIGDIERIYESSKRSGIDFNLAAVPPEFHAESSEPFDREYMTRLFEVGENLARAGYPWAKTPGELETASAD